MAAGDRNTDSFDLRPDGGTVDNAGTNDGAGAPGNADSFGRNTSTIDPANAFGGQSSGPEYTGGRNADGSPTKKRGRKPGSGKQQQKQADYSQDIGGISALLLGIHGFLQTTIPEMELSKDEADELANAINRVERHYPAVAAVLSGKIMDHIALAAIAAKVYGPRFAAIKIRKAGEAAVDVTPPQQPNFNETVYPFHTAKPGA